MLHFLLINAQNDVVHIIHQLIQKRGCSLSYRVCTTSCSMIFVNKEKPCFLMKPLHHPLGRFELVDWFLPHLVFFPGLMRRGWVKQHSLQRVPRGYPGADGLLVQVHLLLISNKFSSTQNQKRGDFCHFAAHGTDFSSRLENYLYNCTGGKTRSIPLCADCCL